MSGCVRALRRLEWGFAHIFRPANETFAPLTILCQSSPSEAKHSERKQSNATTSNGRLTAHLLLQIDPIVRPEVQSRRWPIAVKRRSELLALVLTIAFASTSWLLGRPWDLTTAAAALVGFVGFFVLTWFITKLDARARRRARPHTISRRLFNAQQQHQAPSFHPGD